MKEAGNDKAKELGEAKVGKLLWLFAVPAITGMLLNALYNVVDRIFIGRGVNTLALTGLTVSFPIMIILMAFSMLAGMGATTLISIHLGENKKDEADRTAAQGLMLLIVLGVAVPAIIFMYLEPFLYLFGVSPASLPYAKDYLQIILAGNVLMSIGFGMSNMIRAEGQPVVAMTGMIIGAVSNILLDYVAIFVLQMGVQGAALATVLAQGLSGFYILFHYLSGRTSVKLHLKNFLPQPNLSLKIMAIGFPPFALQAVHSFQNLVLNRSLLFYGGDLAIAAVGVVFSLGSFLFMPVIGIAQAAQPIIGYNYGARQMERVKNTLKLAIFWGTVIITIGYLITRLFPQNLIALFSENDTALIEIGVVAMHKLYLVLPLVGFQIVGSNYFQAIGKPFKATVLSLSRQVLLFIPLLLILPRYFGLEGIYISAPLADIGAVFLTAFYLYLEFRSPDKSRVRLKNTVESKNV